MTSQINLLYELPVGLTSSFNRAVGEGADGSGSLCRFKQYRQQTQYIRLPADGLIAS